jgi:hypothetical protein
MQGICGTALGVRRPRADRRRSLPEPPRPLSRTCPSTRSHSSRRASSGPIARSRAPVLGLAADVARAAFIGLGGAARGVEGVEGQDLAAGVADFQEYGWLPQMVVGRCSSTTRINRVMVSWMESGRSGSFSRRARSPCS